MGRKTVQIAPPAYQRSRKGACLRQRPAPTSPSRMPFDAGGILASCSPSAKCPGLGRKVVSRLQERPRVLRVRCRLPISTARSASVMAAFGYWGRGHPRPFSTVFCQYCLLPFSVVFRSFFLGFCCFFLVFCCFFLVFYSFLLFFVVFCCFFAVFCCFSLFFLSFLLFFAAFCCFLLFFVVFRCFLLFFVFFCCF